MAAGGLVIVFWRSGSRSPPSRTFTSQKISGLVQRAGWFCPSRSSRSFRTQRMRSLCRHISGSTFFLARFWSCRCRRSWSRPRRDFWPLCSIICSAPLCQHHYLVYACCRYTLLMPPPIVCLCLSPAGDPQYISFLRFTPGVASSVFLIIFAHFEHTIIVIVVVCVSLMCAR